MANTIYQELSQCLDAGKYNIVIRRCLDTSGLNDRDDLCYLLGIAYIKSGMSNHDIADRIRADKIDILIDLAGHTGDNRLGVFALRPASVQATYLGYPNTSGLDAIDYRITDEVLDPVGSEQFYTEKLHRIANGFSCYQPPRFTRISKSCHIIKMVI